MSLTLRPAVMVEDREQLLQIFTRNFHGELTEGFDWYQSLNPAGRGWTWVLYDRNTKAIVGTTSLFPRDMYVDGKKRKVGQVMYFAVEPRYRSLGPAVMLQRATFEPVDRGELDFCYDCPPHEEGMSTFVRLGMKANCEMIRYVLPLRSDEYLTKRLGRRSWTKPVIGAVNMLLQMRKPHRSLPGLDISLFETTFGEEFSQLNEKISTSGAIRMRRSAVDLNWRFRDDRIRNRYRTLIARRQGVLLAFVVLSLQTDNRALVIDVFGEQLPVICPALFEAAIDICRRENMQCVEANCVEDSELGVLLQSVGFRRRERAARIVAYEKPNGNSKLNSGMRWAFTQIEYSL